MSKDSVYLMLRRFFLIAMTYETIDAILMNDANAVEQLHSYGFQLAICALPEIKIMFHPIRDIFVKPRETDTSKYVH